MLQSLSVRNFVIVDELELDFAAGFSVLTGETGAGKSILIDALAIALGERADADVIREGATRAEVAAEFRPNAAATAWLAANDFLDGSAALLRRTVDAGGRSRAYINGGSATVTQLRELGELLVDVHGQHAHQSLLKPAAQLQLLDAHGGLQAQGLAVAAAHAEWRGAQRAADEAQRMAGAAQAEQQRLRWIADELDEIAPQPGEWEAVEAEHARLA
ncbi:MAG TPA: AAA family ATPase, partial [Burkholderiaceae bacterium]|nr:AAA family ATPase [Burkholderiaceae bacterium]